MAGSCFADRLGEFMTLTGAERHALESLEQRERTLRRGTNLVREHERAGELFILRRGMMMGSVVLDDGSRQIVQFLFPGDMIGTSALIYAKSPETLTALTEADVCPFERAALARLLEAHPRLSAAIMVLQQMERVALTDRLAGVGRTSAKARVAAVLIEVRDRMRRVAGGGGTKFVLGLTQEEIGDATGLTAVHVNRMMRQLEEEGLIAREAGRIAFRDDAALRRAANHVDRSEGVDLTWLPAPR